MRALKKGATRGPCAWAVGLGALRAAFPSDGALGSRSLGPAGGKAGSWSGCGVPCERCLPAAGFQAFEVQLVLRQALPDVWTALRDQAVSPPARAPEPPHRLSSAKAGLCGLCLSVSFCPPPLLPSLAAFPGSGHCLLSPQVIVKKVSKQHRWYLQHTSCDRESCWREKILLSARGFSVFFQMLVKAQKVGPSLSSGPAAVSVSGGGTAGLPQGGLVDNWLCGSDGHQSVVGGLEGRLSLACQHELT